MSHTPGPWYSSGPRDYGHCIVQTQKGAVAHVYPPRAQANARLIAAAPDLLEATESLLELLCALIRDEVLEVDSEYPEDYQRLNAARAVIAKARKS